MIEKDFKELESLRVLGKDFLATLVFKPFQQHPRHSRKAERIALTLLNLIDKFSLGLKIKLFEGQLINPIIFVTQSPDILENFSRKIVRLGSCLQKQPRFKIKGSLAHKFTVAKSLNTLPSDLQRRDRLIVVYFQSVAHAFKHNLLTLRNLLKEISIGITENFFHKDSFDTILRIAFPYAIISTKEDFDKVVKEALVNEESKYDDKTRYQTSIIEANSFAAIIGEKLTALPVASTTQAEFKPQAQAATAQTPTESKVIKVSTLSLFATEPVSVGTSQETENLQKKPVKI